MKGHLGAVLTTGLAAIALALAMIQAAVLLHGAHRQVEGAAAVRIQSNRFSVPGGRSGVPWMPFEKPQAPAGGSEGRSPEKQHEERRPPPPRQRGVPPNLGPRPPRRAVA